MVAFIVLPAVALTLFVCARWAFWLRSRYGAPRWVRPIHWVFGLGGCAQLFINFWTLRKLNGHSGGGEATDPAAKATLVAEGVRTGMTVMALSVVFAMIALVVMLLLTWRYHWDATTPKPRGEPPYR